MNSSATHALAHAEPKFQREALIGVSAFVAALLYLENFTTTHFGMQLHTVIGWGSFALLVVLYGLRKSRSMPLRMFFIILSGFIAFRYMYWRTTETLLYTGPADFLAMSALFLAEAYAIAVHFLGMAINTWPLKRPPIAAPDDPALLPTVDILIPTYNESEDLVRVTVTAAMQIDYPRDKFRVFILDDGGTFAKRSNPDSGMAAWDRHYRLRRMAEDLGAHYLTRPRNDRAKAGNINHALEHTSGDLVLILDCDHVPTRDILRRTVGFFVADPKLFLVQTPHFFINPTPVEKNLGGVASTFGENDMFYRVIHPGLDFWGASYFCGSAAVLRRSHLMEIGGISGATITEDVETALALHGRGYHSVYFERPMVCGLSPETYDDYIIQRQRWAQGMLQTFLLDNPLLKRGLTPAQRLCYFNSCFFWLFGIARAIYFLAPATFLLFGLRIYNASWPQILAYVVPYVVSSWFVMDLFYSRGRRPLFSEVYESIQSIFLLPAIASVFANPHKPTFKVTPKGHTVERESLNPMSVTFLALVGVNVLSVIMAGFRWVDDPLQRSVITVTVVWSIYNIILGTVSLGAFWERRQVRGHHRIDVEGELVMEVPRLRARIPGSIRDVSLTGIGFEIPAGIALAARERVYVEARDSEGHEHRLEMIVKHAIPRGERTYCGSQFASADACDPKTIHFTFGDSERWLQLWLKRQAAGGTPRMLAHFLRLGARGLGVSALLLWERAGSLFTALRLAAAPASARRAPKKNDTRRQAES